MDMSMSSIRPNRVEVVTSVQRRRRWTPKQKLEIVKQTNEPGSSVSLVDRQQGLTAAQLFQRRKAYLEGSLVSVGANETVAPAAVEWFASLFAKLVEIFGFKRLQGSDQRWALA
jgi:transposase